MTAVAILALLAYAWEGPLDFLCAHHVRHRQARLTIGYLRRKNRAQAGAVAALGRAYRQSRAKGNN